MSKIIDFHNWLNNVYFSWIIDGKVREVPPVGDTARCIYIAEDVGIIATFVDFLLIIVFTMFAISWVPIRVINKKIRIK